MSTHPIDPATLKFARGLVKIKARQIAHHSPAVDRADTEQTLRLEILLRWPSYDAARGSREAFVERVVRGKLCKILRARRRKRKPPADDPQSIDRPDPRDDQREVALRLDVQTVVERLSPRLRKACEHLRRESPSKTASLMGLHRPILMRNLARARAQFRKFELDFYL